MTEVANEIQNKRMSLSTPQSSAHEAKHITQLRESRFRLQGRQHSISGDSFWYNCGNVIECSVRSL